MKKYNYNERLIENLNLNYFIKKYNLNNKKYNEAIFCALSSVSEHQKRGEKFSTKAILLGDYYSFEYYSLLKEELTKLKALTQVMKKCYEDLANKSLTVNDFNIQIVRLWLSFYDAKLENEDELMLIQNGENNVRTV